jgi:hypothetical protein
MKEKHTDNYIEQTFKKVFDQTETEPSKKFWVGAFSTILERTNKLYNRKVNVWKMTSFTLAAMLFCLVFYTFYTGNKINSYQHQITFLEKQQVSNRIKDKSIENNAVLNTKDVVNIPYTNSLATNDVLSGKSSAPTFKKTLQPNGGRDSDQLNATISADTTAQAGVNNASTMIQENERNESVSSDILTNGNSATSKPLPSITAIINRKSSFSDSTQTDSGKRDLSPSSQTEPIISKSTNDSSLLTLNASGNDSANHSTVKNPKPISNPNSTYSRFSIGLSIAPSLGSEFKEVNNAYVNSGGVECPENDRAAFDAGINIDYTISHKWTLQSGLGYHNYSYSIEPTFITAQQTTQGVLGYSLITSAAILDLPYYDAQIQTLDSIKVRGDAYFGYLSIPLQIRYSLTTQKHWGIYIIGGIVTNFLVNKGAFIHWESNMDMDDEFIHDIDGLNEIQLSYTAGAGLNYFLGKGFSIYGEPFFVGSATPIDKNTPEISYPFSVGLRVGLFYKF